MVTDPSAPDQPPGTGQPGHRPGARRHAAQHRVSRGPRGGIGRRHRGRLLALPVILAVIAVTVAACIAPPRTLADGQDAASFSLPRLTSPPRSDQRITLSSYAGKPVIINFFASWSPPCTAETQLLAHFYRFYHHRVHIIGVDSRDNRAAALRLLHRSLVTYPVADDPNLVVAARYRVPGIPATFFLNAQHQVVKADYGWLNWKKLRTGVRMMDES
jgi:thiol-disulfide isomerase/thioredoxin